MCFVWNEIWGCFGLDYKIWCIIVLVIIIVLGCWEEFELYVCVGLIVDLVIWLMLDEMKEVMI